MKKQNRYVYICEHMLLCPRRCTWKDTFHYQKKETYLKLFQENLRGTIKDIWPPKIYCSFDNKITLVEYPMWVIEEEIDSKKYFRRKKLIKTNILTRNVHDPEKDNKRGNL